VEQRISIDFFRVEVFLEYLGVDQHALPGFWLHFAAPIRLKWLGAVAPPGVNSVGKEALIRLPPVHGARLRVKRIVSDVVAE